MSISEEPAESIGRANLVLVSGPTGTGKSRVAVELAERIDGEIVNADSVQIYKGFDIGSAKPEAELRSRAPHHLYDHLDPHERLDVAKWVELTDRVVRSIDMKGHVPIVVGGTHFYLRALLRGLPDLPARQHDLRTRLDSILSKPRGPRHLHRLLRGIDPTSAERIDQEDRHRIERAIEVFAATGRPISTFEAPSPDQPPRYPHVQFALFLDRSHLRQRLDARVEKMYEAGLIDEVRDLVEQHGEELHALRSIGYREALEHLRGEIDRGTAVEKTKRRTRAFSRRQMTWLRAERDVQWLDAARPTASIVESMIGTLRESRNFPGPKP